jgi:hypothetical protein
LFVECHEPFVDPGATAVDACSGDISSAIRVTGTVNVNCPGDYTLVYKISDDENNRARVSRVVTVRDTQPPIVICPGDFNVRCSINLLAPVEYPSPIMGDLRDLAEFLGRPRNRRAVVIDACDSTPSFEFIPPSGSMFPVGAHSVIFRATDAAGNQASCSFTVTRAALDFTGFLHPIEGADATGGSYANPVKAFKYGNIIGVKFIARCDDSLVRDGVHTLRAIRALSATSNEPPIDLVQSGSPATGNQFLFIDGKWHFNLDTRASQMTAGIWQLVAWLSDGSQHRAWIQIK